VTQAKGAKAEKPQVVDSKGNVLELYVRVKLTGEKDKQADGSPSVGTITGLEYQRKRAVIKVDGQEKLAVRPASTLWAVKNRSGKIERVERAVRAGRKPKAATPAAAEGAKA
jgi:hypothetical protein